MNTLTLIDNKELLKQEAETIISNAEKEVRKLTPDEQVKFNGIKD